MAGILANSASKQMVSGNSPETVIGYVAKEQITLSVTPTATAWTWAMSIPSGSAAAKSALSSTSVASPTFTPDVGGIYTVTFSSGATSYSLGITVVAPSVSVPVNAILMMPVADASVTAPTIGLKLYCSSTQSNVLCIKNTSGTVYTVNVTAVP